MPNFEIVTEYICSLFVATLMALLQEKFNVWMALLNMELKYGTSQSLEKAFARAVAESKVSLPVNQSVAHTCTHLLTYLLTHSPHSLLPLCYMDLVASLAIRQFREKSTVCIVPQSS